jgi:hypothetical protein
MNLRPVAVMVLLLTSSAALATPKKAGRKSAVTSPPAVTAPAPAQAAEPRTVLHGTQHVVFEGSELGGQGHKGAITIVERPELGIHSLLRQRANYRAELGDALR